MSMAYAKVVLDASQGIAPNYLALQSCAPTASRRFSKRHNNVLTMEQAKKRRFPPKVSVTSLKLRKSAGLS